MKSKAYAFANAVDYSVEDLSKKVTFAETANNAKQYFSKGEQNSSQRHSSAAFGVG